MKAETNQSWILEDHATKWEGNKKYFLEVLEAMPEADYAFSPAEGMMSFQEQAVHIEYGFHYHWRTSLNPPLPKMNLVGKASIVASFKQIFDHIIASFRQMDAEVLHETTSMWYGTSTRNRVIHLMDNHLAHHRGQMTVYLRLKGIKPPKYIGW